MKRIFLIIIIAMLFIICSCDNDKSIIIKNTNDESEKGKADIVFNEDEYFLSIEYIEDIKQD